MEVVEATAGCMQVSSTLAVCHMLPSMHGSENLVLYHKKFQHELNSVKSVSYTVMLLDVAINLITAVRHLICQ